MKRRTKGILIIGIIIAVLATAFMVSTKIFVDSINKPAGNKITSLSASQNSKKALVVYQPSKETGITENVANQIAKGINSKGYEVTVAYPGKYLSADISEYSVIVFGSPVYAGRTSTVLSDYIKRINNFSGKKVVLFTTGLLDDSKQLKELQTLIKNSHNPIKVQFKADSKNNSSKAYDLGIQISEDSI